MLPVTHLEAAIRRPQCTHVTSSLGSCDKGSPKMSTAGLTCKWAGRDLQVGIRHACPATCNPAWKKRLQDAALHGLAGHATCGGANAGASVEAGNADLVTCPHP